MANPLLPTNTVYGMPGADYEADRRTRTPQELAAAQQALGPLAGNTAVQGFAGMLPTDKIDAANPLVMQGTNTQQINDAYTQSQAALQQQQAFAQALQAQGGIGNQSQVFAQQQALAQQLQQNALGQGPNPAQAALAQATGQNVSQTAALMAGQRGAQANPGLIARQAGMAGANVQQQAAGQSATLQAQQQLAAQQALAQQQAQMAGLATQQVGQQQQAIGNYNQLVQGQQGILQGALASQNNANVGLQGSYNAANSQKSAGLMGMVGSVVGGGLSGIGAALGLGGGKSPVKAAHGGEITHTGLKGPRSFVGKWMKDGGAVPGKARVAGDSYANDKVKAMLSPGEIVIPRSVAQGKDPVGDSAKFVAALMAKRGHRG